MPLIEGGVKLKHGSLTKIADKAGLSIEHVRLVAKGERQGSKELVQVIKRTAKRQADKAA